MPSILGVLSNSVYVLASKAISSPSEVLTKKYFPSWENWTESPIFVWTIFSNVNKLASFHFLLTVDSLYLWLFLHVPHSNSRIFTGRENNSVIWAEGNGVNVGCVPL